MARYMTTVALGNTQKQALQTQKGPHRHWHLSEAA